jgi:predicted rRNA methylase YqxC with S4 and FtsJ domains
VSGAIRDAGFDVVGTVRSPIRGAKGNAEVLAVLRPVRPRLTAVPGEPAH